MLTKEGLLDRQHDLMKETPTRQFVRLNELYIQIQLWRYGERGNSTREPNSKERLGMGFDKSRGSHGTYRILGAYRDMDKITHKTKERKREREE